MGWVQFLDAKTYTEDNQVKWNETFRPDLWDGSYKLEENANESNKQTNKRVYVPFLKLHLDVKTGKI